MNLSKKHTFLVYVLSLPIVVVGMYGSFLYADLGILHFIWFLLGSFCIIDAVKTYRKRTVLSIDIVLQTAMGAFMFAEHVYLYQAFLQGLIDF